MIRTVTKKKTAKKKPAGKPKRTRTFKGRLTPKGRAMAEFEREHKNSIGLTLSDAERSVVASMTTEQVLITSSMIRSAWAKGNRYGGYQERKG